jgi:uncharacterized protein YndB with AHSA1/START domain
MSAVKSGARAVADVSRGSIVASVEIAAPIERVFAALTSDEITRWWGSDDSYRTTGWQADLRVHGAWRATGKGADGSAFSVGGEYLEIDPPRLITQTWKPDWDAGLATTLSYRLEPIDGGTRVTVHHDGFGERADSCRSHAEGWERVLDWLRAYVS